MLSQTLSTLVSDGLMRRVQFSPQRVECELTDAGQRIATALRHPIDTVYDVTPDVLLARSQVGADTAAASGSRPAFR